MTVKQEWENYLSELKNHVQDVKEFIKTLSDEDVTTLDDGPGSNPGSPQPPPPPTRP